MLLMSTDTSGEAFVPWSSLLGGGDELTGFKGCLKVERSPELWVSGGANDSE
jgi:hypothetical protein